MNYFDGTTRYYLNYYVSHSLIIVMPIFMFLHLDLKLPRLSWFRLWINLNILMAIIMPINFLIGSNYMYVTEPPQGDNPLVIGDWPYYIFLWEIFILIIAYMVYSISRRKLTLWICENNFNPISYTFLYTFRTVLHILSYKTCRESENR